LTKLALFVVLAASLAGQLPEAHLTAARTAELAGDFASAEREYQQALALRPDAAIYQRLGLVRHLQNKFQEAIPAFEQSLKLQPNQWSARLFLGIDLYKTNQFERALGQLKQADKLRQNEPEIRFWLGLSHLARKEYLTGLAMLETLSSDQPKNLELLRILAEHYAVFSTTLVNNVAEKYPGLSSRAPNSCTSLGIRRRRRSSRGNLSAIAEAAARPAGRGGSTGEIEG